MGLPLVIVREETYVSMVGMGCKVAMEENKPPFEFKYSFPMK